MDVTKSVIVITKVFVEFKSISYFHEQSSYLDNIQVGTIAQEHFDRLSILWKYSDLNNYNYG